MKMKDNVKTRAANGRKIKAMVETHRFEYMVKCLHHLAADRAFDACERGLAPDMTKAERRDLAATEREYDRLCLKLDALRAFLDSTMIR